MYPTPLCRIASSNRRKNPMRTILITTPIIFAYSFPQLSKERAGVRQDRDIDLIKRSSTSYTELTTNSNNYLLLSTISSAGAEQSEQGNILEVALDQQGEHR